MQANKKFANDYSILDVGQGIRIIVNQSVWKKQLSKTRSRIYMPGYFVGLNTDIEKFVDLLKKLDTYKADKEEKSKILNAAKENNHVLAYKLLDSLTKAKTSVEVSEEERTEIINIAARIKVSNDKFDIERDLYSKSYEL